LSSEYPLAAGLYRYDDAKKLVSVDIAQKENPTVKNQNFEHTVSLYRKFSLNPLNLILGKRSYLAYNQSGTYIYNLEGYDLLPYQIKKIPLSKNVEKLTYEDINGNLQTQKPVFLDKNPKKKFINPIKLIFSLFLGLGLCSFAYYFLVARGYQKKLLPLLQNHLRGPNQKRNQN